MTTQHVVTNKGGAWVGLHDNDPIRIIVDASGNVVDLVFDGEMELSVGLTEQAARRCRDELDKALTELAAARTKPHAV